MRAIGYVRVSHREQVESGLGLADQKYRIEEAVSRRGWDLERIEADEGISGRSIEKRPALRDLIARKQFPPIIRQTDDRGELEPRPNQGRFGVEATHGSVSDEPNRFQVVFSVLFRDAL